jgi:flagella basal body P-ring formation protein FlgA
MTALARPTLARIALAALAFSPAPAVAEVISLPVPRETIYPGDEITVARLRQRGFERASVQEQLVATAAAQVEGATARRTLPAGQPIPRAWVGKAHVLKQGQIATAVFEAGGLRITCAVVTLEAGGEGDIIRVRNLETTATITGAVQANGLIKVN